MYNMEKKGKQYHIPYNIESVGKNIKWGKGKWAEISEKKIYFFLMVMGKNIKVQGT